MALQAVISQIEYALPENVLSNEELASSYPDWSISKIESKTGIVERPVCDPDQCASDLAQLAAEKLLDSGACARSEIDFLLLCTQSPDYFLPTTACILQDRLRLPTSIGALDFNLGCSGYIYGLGLAKGLIETGQATRVLLVTAETYSKFIHPGDRSVRTLFGDAAAATLLVGEERPDEALGPFVYGTDGSGAENLIVPCGALRNPRKRVAPQEQTDDSGNVRTEENLFMNGSSIFTFTLNTVPKALESLLAKARLERADIDLFVFHQANKFMLDALRRKTRIPKEKFFQAYDRFGNTVSSTVPIALKEALRQNVLRKDMTVALLGFGVGYSWGGAIIRWDFDTSTTASLAGSKEQQ